jgi:Skp family chaperone for outer membrane proteins
MPVYRLTPQRGAPVVRLAGNIAKATASGLRLFPAGLQSVDVVGNQELAELDAAGVPLPVAARQRLEVYKAVMRERAKANARVAALREKAYEKARAKRHQEAEQRAALRAQQKAEQAAEKKRQASAERRAKRKTEKLQASAPQAGTPVLPIDHNDSRPPWED